jgi:hypothetical protein
VGTCPTIEIVGLGLSRRVATREMLFVRTCPTIEIVGLGLSRRVATVGGVYCGKRGLGLKRAGKSALRFTSHQWTGFFCL